jgi:L-serine dehydratase
MSAARPPSIFNDVLGPVMRGPSSSHTAGSFRIGRLGAALLGSRPARAVVAFDREGSYAQVFRQQGVDRAFASALLGWPLTDERFASALESAAASGLDLRFDVAALDGADHPNAVELTLWDATGRSARLRAKSVGGGAVVVTAVDQWPVVLTGQAHTLLVEADADACERVCSLVAGVPVARAEAGGRVLLVFERPAALDPLVTSALVASRGVERIRELPPVDFANTGTALFASAAEMLARSAERGLSLGRLALAYEAGLLCRPERELLDEMGRRLRIMREAVRAGLADEHGGLQLLEPSAHRVFRADADGRLAVGGLHARAAARSMAVMHVNGAMGVVCAAPTGGSAGVLPGVLVTMMEERGLSAEGAALALFAASAIGVIVAARATFAAEVAGCQVEIGAASAMAAAAVVEAAGGTAAVCADAAAIAFQNSMGSVCDLVQGMVEIPCHTRNAVAASSAFVCADLVLGGYRNPIPLDETIDAVFAVGQMLPAELRCTAKGGLAVTPSALALKKR